MTIHGTGLAPRFSVNETQRRRATGSGPTAPRATTSSATPPATRLRHRHARRPVDLHLGRQHHRPPRSPDAGGTGRIAACWYSGTSFSIDVNLTDGQTHDLALYALDWANTGRSEQIQITSAATGAVLDTETLSSFSGGVYLQWAISGNVVIKFTRLGGPNAVVSGLFFDPTAHVHASDAHPTANTDPDANTHSDRLAASRRTRQRRATGSAPTAPRATTSSATPPAIPPTPPSRPSGQSNYTWAASTTDPSALQDAGGTGRIAACWYAGTTFSIDVNLTDGQTHDLALYAVDWPSPERDEQIQITSAATGTVLDTETLSSFSGGVYLQWAISGNVVITITCLSGPNAVLSGLFFDPPTGSQRRPIPTTSRIRRSMVTTSSSKGPPSWRTMVVRVAWGGYSPLGYQTTDQEIRFDATCGTILVWAAAKWGVCSTVNRWGRSEYRVVACVAEHGQTSGAGSRSRAGLDAANEHEYMVWWGSGAIGNTMYVSQLQTLGGTGLDTANLPARPVVACYGDSIMTGSGIPNFDSTLSFVHDLGVMSNYQVSNQAQADTQVSGHLCRARSDRPERET